MNYRVQLRMGHFVDEYELTTAADTLVMSDVSSVIISEESDVVSQSLRYKVIIVRS